MARWVKDNSSLNLICTFDTNAAVRRCPFFHLLRHPERTGTAEPFAQDVNWDGRRVLQAVQDNEFFVISHSEYRDMVSGRHAELMAAFDRADIIARQTGYHPNRPR